MQRTNNLYLIYVLSSLGSQALLNVAGMRSSLAAASRVYVRALNEPGVHPAGVVHLRDGQRKESLFAKVQKSNYTGVQNLEKEMYFLSKVAPLITAENPALRSPLPLAYYPDRRLLLMEFVPGNSLKHHLFDVVFNSAPRRNLGELLQSAGRWLGSLHRLTRKSTSENPLEWLLNQFESDRTRQAFELFSIKEDYESLRKLLRASLSAKPSLRRNLSDVHGEFTPIHVMVAGNAIYVVDFGNSREGFPYEDIGLFESFYDCLLPWRAAAGSYRMDLQMQRDNFVKGYFEEAGTAFTAADRAIMRWVRIISFARMLNGGQHRFQGWSGWAYSRLALRTLRTRFVALCQNQLDASKQSAADLFEEEPYAQPNKAFAPFCASIQS